MITFEDNASSVICYSLGDRIWLKEKTTTKVLLSHSEEIYKNCSSYEKIGV